MKRRKCYIFNTTLHLWRALICKYDVSTQDVLWTKGKLNVINTKRHKNPTQIQKDMTRLHCWCNTLYIFDFVKGPNKYKVSNMFLYFHVLMGLTTDYTWSQLSWSMTDEERAVEQFCGNLEIKLVNTRNVVFYPLVFLFKWEKTWL